MSTLPAYCGVIAMLGLGCSSNTGPAALPPGGIHVLFVGNSLTYVNDLPNTLAALADAAGDTIRVVAQTGPGLALIDHLNGATLAAQTIARGGWDFVILQQGPTPAGICRDSLVLWSELFDARIRQVGAVPALLMTWPAVGSSIPFDEVRDSFRGAAAAVHGMFLPAGEAWRAALGADPGVALYGPDGFHPSPTGTFLTALEIYERLTGKDARTLPPVAFSGLSRLSLPESLIVELQTAAHQANLGSPAYPVGSASRASAAAGSC